MRSIRRAYLTCENGVSSCIQVGGRYINSEPCCGVLFPIPWSSCSIILVWSLRAATSFRQEEEAMVFSRFGFVKLLDDCRACTYHIGLGMWSRALYEHRGEYEQSTRPNQDRGTQAIGKGWTRTYAMVNSVLDDLSTHAC